MKPPNYSIIPPMMIPAMNALRASPDFTIDLQKEQSRVMIERLNAETERWLRKAIERGPGWNVWRSHMRSKGEGVGDGTYDPFVIVHDFALVPPDAAGPGPGLMFHQPELTDGERVRLLAGRHDWRDQDWEDECGVSDCGHSCCEDYRR